MAVVISTLLLRQVLFRELDDKSVIGIHYIADPDRADLGAQLVCIPLIKAVVFYQPVDHIHICYSYGIINRTGASSLHDVLIVLKPRRSHLLSLDKGQNVYYDPCRRLHGNATRFAITLD